MKQLTATFVRGKETKNTLRYEEEAGESSPLIVTIYVQKTTLKRLAGDQPPKRIRVTIEAVQ